MNDDLIKRSDVFAALNNGCSWGCSWAYDGLMEQAIMEIPSACKWISVNKDLPKVEARFSDAEWFRQNDDGIYEPVGVYTCYESEPVLVSGTYNGRKCITSAVYLVWKFEDGRPDEMAWHESLEDACDFDNVKKWMPLPDDVETEGGEDE